MSTEQKPCCLKNIFGSKAQEIDKMSFANKVVIVTGASSGIGATTAKLFAKQKAKVVMVGRNIQKLNKVEEDIKKTGSEPLVIVADITNDEGAQSVITKTVDHFGKLDILVNNAGAGTATPLLQEDYISKFDNLMAINLRSVAVMIHAAAPHLIKTKGNIINISSIVSTSTVKEFSIYSASKAGLDHLTRCLALEFAEHGVRVNTVNPGPVATDFLINAGVTEDVSNNIQKDYANSLPLKRISESIEIADVILFLAGDTGKSITGSSYVIDCGGSLGLSNEIKSDF